MSLMCIDALIVAKYATVDMAASVLQARVDTAKTEGAARKNEHALAVLLETGRIDPEAQKAAYAAQKPPAAPVATPVAAPVVIPPSAVENPMQAAARHMQAAGATPEAIVNFITSMK